MEGPVDVAIVSSGHDVADARLHRQVHALVTAGLSVEVVALGSRDDAPSGALVRTLRRRGRVVRAWRSLALPWQTRARVQVAFDPDVAFGCWIRSRAARIPGVRAQFYASDVHEDYRLLLEDRAWARGPRGLAGQAWAALGGWATRRADAVIVADDHLYPEIKHRVILRNLADKAFLPGPSARDNTPRAIYVGDLRASRGLFTMLEVMESAPAWHLDLVGPIAAKDLERAETILQRPALKDRVQWHGRLPPRQAWQHADGAWLGFLLLEDTPAFREAIPSKLYEYLYCGLPVVATALPRTQELLATTGAGITVTNAPEAAALLNAWAKDHRLLDEYRRRALDVPPDGQDHHQAFVAACRDLAQR